MRWDTLGRSGAPTGPDDRSSSPGMKPVATPCNRRLVALAVTVAALLATVTGVVVASPQMASAACTASPGFPDPNFGSCGIVTDSGSTGQTLAVTSVLGGAVVVAGTGSSQQQFAATEFAADGKSVSWRFTSAFSSTTSASALAVAGDGSGNVYLAGDVDSSSTVGLPTVVKLTSAGLRDSTFATAGAYQLTAVPGQSGPLTLGSNFSAVAVYPSASSVPASVRGDILVAGVAGTSAAGLEAVVVRLTSSGMVDTSFGNQSPSDGVFVAHQSMSGKPDQVGGIAIDASGNAYVAGTKFTTSSSTEGFVLSLGANASAPTATSIGPVTTGDDLSITSLALSGTELAVAGTEGTVAPPVTGVPFLEGVATSGSGGFAPVAFAGGTGLLENASSVAFVGSSGSAIAISGLVSGESDVGVAVFTSDLNR